MLIQHDKPMKQTWPGHLLFCPVFNYSLSKYNLGACRNAVSLQHIMCFWKIISCLDGQPGRPRSIKPHETQGDVQMLKMGPGLGWAPWKILCSRRPSSLYSPLSPFIRKSLVKGKLICRNQRKLGSQLLKRCLPLTLKKGFLSATGEKPFLCWL